MVMQILLKIISSVRIPDPNAPKVEDLLEDASKVTVSPSTSKNT
jgi:hypothetical protein